MYRPTNTAGISAPVTPTSTPRGRYTPLNTDSPFPAALLVKDNPRAPAVSVSTASLEAKDFKFSHVSYLDRQHTSPDDLKRIQVQAKMEKWPELTKEQFASIHKATIELPAQSMLVGMGAAGRGVCTTVKVSKGTMYEYVGVVRADTLAEQHSSGRTNNSFLFSLENKDGDVIASVDGTEPFRGYVGMFQHAPLAISDLEFDDSEVEMKAQSANGIVREVMVEGIPRLVYQVIKDIEIGEGFFCDYGANYFLKLRMNALIFDKHTLQPLPKESYRTKEVILIGTHLAYPEKCLLRITVERELITAMAERERIAKGRTFEPLELSGITVPGKVLGKIVGDNHSSFYLLPLNECVLAEKILGPLSTLHPKLIAPAASLERKEEASAVQLGVVEPAPAPKQIYQQALADYKNNDFSSAIAKATTALGLFQEQKNDTRAEQASCHSALASCYRDISNLPKAIEHCKRARHLREECLPVGHKLIADIIRKESELTTLLSAGAVAPVTAGAGVLLAAMGALGTHSAPTASSSRIAAAAGSAPLSSATVASPAPAKTA